SKRSLKTLRELTGLSERLAFCLRELVELLARVQETITAFTKRIGAEADRAQVAALVETLPQCGPQTALTLIAELGDVTRFRATPVLLHASATPPTSHITVRSRSAEITTFAGCFPSGPFGFS